MKTNTWLSDTIEKGLNKLEAEKKLHPTPPKQENTRKIDTTSNIYGYMENGSFHEFPNGTPAHTPDYNSTNNYTNSTTRYSYLMQDIPGYASG